MKFKIKTLVVIPAAALLFVGGLLLTAQKRPVAAAANDVIINEIMYHPVSGNENDEFLELYNTTGSTIDLEGWKFTKGIILTTTSFTAGTTIPAGGYLIVSPSPAQTLTTYGVAATASYAGSQLSNGGEEIRLVDNADAIVDSVTYSDSPPWPAAADGTGPSIELKATNLNNDDAANWAASRQTMALPDAGTLGTPLAANSGIGLDLATIDNVTDPNNVQADTPVDITAEVQGTAVSSVKLYYKVGFDGETMLTMLDDGAHNDGAASDNVYGAQIPGQSLQSLVRFRIDATNGDGVQKSPSTDDGMNYHGYYINDDSITGVEPIIQWFMDDPDYNTMMTTDLYGNVYYPAVVVYGDTVYDNTRVRLRGSFRELDKKPLKFQLPRGYSFDIAGGSNIPANEFEMLIGLDNNVAQLPGISWYSEQVGLATYDVIVTRLQRNGQFEGQYYYMNKFQREWREAKGYADGELYENMFEAVSGTSGPTHILAYKDEMLNGFVDKNNQQYTDFILDTLDIPKNITYMVGVGAIRGSDHDMNSNALQFYSNGRERWSPLLWDQGGISGSFVGLSPADGRSSNRDSCWMFCAVYDQPSLRPLYLRRFRTVVDKLYANNALENKFIEIQNTHQALFDLDVAKWPDRYYFGDINNLVGMIRDNKKLLLNYISGFNWMLPPSQTNTDRQAVSFDVINADADNANEYIRLTNNANTPVDLSGWTIEELGYTLEAGAVIPADGVIYLLRDDGAYKDTHPAVLVGGQYSNDLGSNGTLTLKTDTGDTIDTANY